MSLIPAPEKKSQGISVSSSQPGQHNEFQSGLQETLAQKQTNKKEKHKTKQQQKKQLQFLSQKGKNSTKIMMLAKDRH